MSSSLYNQEDQQITRDNHTKKKTGTESAIIAESKLNEQKSLSDEDENDDDEIIVDDDGEIDRLSLSRSSTTRAATTSNEENDNLVQDQGEEQGEFTCYSDIDGDDRSNGSYKNQN